jgi:hypothetical protein
MASFTDYAVLSLDNVQIWINQVVMRLVKYSEIKTSIETGLPVPEYPLIADNEMRLDDDGNPTAFFRFPHTAAGELSVSGVTAAYAAREDRDKKRALRASKTRPESMAEFLAPKYFPLEIQAMYKTFDPVNWNLGITSQDPLTLVNVMRAHLNQSNTGNATAAAGNLPDDERPRLRGAPFQARQR